MNQQERLLDVMNSFKTAMLVTRQPNGQITARPMAVAKLEENGDMWFATEKDSGKIEDIQSNGQVAVTLQNSSQFVSVSGTAKVVDDRSKVGELWSEFWRVWFPGGKDDPSLTLLHLTPTDAEYWDNSGLKGWKYLMKAGVAYFQGEKPESSPETNASVSLN